MKMILFFLLSWEWCCGSRCSDAKACQALTDIRTEPFNVSLTFLKTHKYSIVDDSGHMGLVHGAPPAKNSLIGV